MYQQRTATLFAVPIALLIFGSCQDEVRPPFASDGDGGAAGGIIVNPGVGLPNVTPGSVNPSAQTSQDTEGTVGQPVDQGSPITTSNTTSNTFSTPDTTDATTATVDTASPSTTVRSTTVPSSAASLAPSSLDTSPGNASTSNVTSNPSGGTDVLDDSETALDTNTNTSSYLDGGIVDAGSSDVASL